MSLSQRTVDVAATIRGDMLGRGVKSLTRGPDNRLTVKKFQEQTEESFVLARVAPFDLLERKREREMEKE